MNRPTKELAYGLAMLCALGRASLHAATHAENFDSASGSPNSYSSSSGMDFSASGGSFIFSTQFNSFFSPYISGKAAIAGCNACTAPTMRVSWPAGQRSIVFGWGTQSYTSAHVVAYRNNQTVWTQNQSGTTSGGLYKNQFSHNAANTGEYFDGIAISFPGGGQANTGYAVLLDNFTSNDAYAALSQTGSHQLAPINVPYTMVLSVTVRDYQNQPVPDVEVDFSAPSNGGASARFTSTGDMFDIAMTDANGVAVSSSLTANGVVGAFVVDATTVPSVGSATFRLRNVTSDTIFANDFE